MMYWRLAWRNIWRNPRRTAIILVAVSVGVWSMIFVGALMRGFGQSMFENGIATLTGDIQIHKKGYREDPVVENSMEDFPLVKTFLGRSLPPETLWAPRIRVNAIASNARQSAGITFVGIDPLKEEGISFIGRDAVVEGDYIAPGDMRGILVGKALLDQFETRIGHKLVIMSQDAEKEVASRAFRIVGVFRTEMAATEKQFVFVTLSAAEKMLKMEGRISEVSLVLPGHDNLDATASGLKQNLPGDFTVHTWRELLPLLESWLVLLDVFTYIWFVVIFLAMAFGIVNTLLMAVFERMREFGLLKALGMKPFWIIRGVLAESVLLLTLGIIIGDIVGLLFSWGLSGIGIDLSAFAAGSEMAGISRVLYPVILAKDVLAADLVVFLLGIFISLYPATKAAKFTPIEAMNKV